MTTKERSFHYSDFPILLIAALASLIALAAIPFWFEQAFGYSASVGRVGAAVKTATDAFGCRADITALLAGSVLGISILVRWIHLRGTRRSGLWTLGARSLTEHIIITYRVLANYVPGFASGFL